MLSMVYGAHLKPLRPRVTHNMTLAPVPTSVLQVDFYKTCLPFILFDPTSGKQQERSTGLLEAI
jgi:hypothetical protein